MKDHPRPPDKGQLQHELLVGQADHVVAELRDRPSDVHPTQETAADRMRHYEEMAATLAPLVATAGYFSELPEQHALFRVVLRRLSAAAREQGGFTEWNDLEHYPTLLCRYGILIGGVAGDWPEMYIPALGLTRLDMGEKARPVYVTAASMKVLSAQACQVIVSDGKSNRKTTVSDYLHQTLREPLREQISSCDEYERVFDEVEFLLGVMFASWRGNGMGPVGRFVWREVRQRRRPCPAHSRAPVGGGWLSRR